MKTGAKTKASQEDVFEKLPVPSALRVMILPAITLIGCTTFCLSRVGVAVGNFFGARYKRRAELTGGIILVLLGLKILLEHLGILV